MVTALGSSSFTVAVLGAFNRGKSMLVNALLGAELLPTGIVPLTSITTRIRWGPTVRATISFLSGKMEEIPVPSLSLYVTEAHNPANRKGVAEVVVEVPSRLLSDGVVLLDTPGTGSALARATEITMRLLPKIDAAIVVLAVDPPVSEEEVRFVHAIREYAGKLFFVLNKTDSVDQDQVAEALQYCRTVLATALGQEVEIYPLSARQAVRGSNDQAADQMDAFVGRLLRFLPTGKGYATLGAVVRTSQRLVRNQLLRIGIEERALQSNQDELQGLKGRLQGILQMLQEREETIFHILHGRLERIARLIDEDIDGYRLEHLKGLQAETRILIDGLAGSPKEKASHADASIRKAVERACWQALDTEEPRVNDQLRRSTDLASRETNRALEEISTRLTTLLGLELQGLSIDIELPPPERLYLKFEDQFNRRGSTVEKLSSLLIGASKKRMKNRADNVVWEELDRNLGRIRSDLQERLSKAAKTWETEVRRALGSLRASIQDGANVDLAADVRERRDRLAREKAAVFVVQERLAECDARLRELSSRVA